MIADYRWYKSIGWSRRRAALLSILDTAIFVRWLG